MTDRLTDRDYITSCCKLTYEMNTKCRIVDKRPHRPLQNVIHDIQRRVERETVYELSIGTKIGDLE